MPNSFSKKIIETDELQEVLSHLASDTAIFFDLDNTLLEPCQHFGTVQWGEYYIKKLMSAGEAPEKAEVIAQSMWGKYLPNAALRLLDPNSPSIISQLQQNGHLVLGLTARYPEEASYTHPQLQKLGFEFDRRFADQTILLPFPALFENGVLFASTLNKKGDALLALLEQVNYLPKKIIFIDDKHSHVEELHSTLNPLDLDFVGIRYSKADKRVKAFDPQIADLQMELFPRFVTDEEALELLVPAS